MTCWFQPSPTHKMLNDLICIPSVSHHMGSGDVIRRHMSCLSRTEWWGVIWTFLPKYYCDVADTQVSAFFSNFLLSKESNIYSSIPCCLHFGTVTSPQRKISWILDAVKRLFLFLLKFVHRGRYVHMWQCGMKLFFLTVTFMVILILFFLPVFWRDENKGNVVCNSLWHITS